ncbi:se113 [Alphabaculovirus alterspexiguae]|uniref:Se113 n=1 Tax=Spodoptera exigua multiple nucleopolyhedrovirus TaxID=10454 RepID=A0A3G2JU48_9ABAC|nr:se113 [Spodoptera exigua multiple nucleopolyhedrovirus]AYN45073.1 se113 [Spodoptera exigua multiple nucleopolyhedrovirus]
MDFSTVNLLKNASYSAKHYNRFAHYMTMINLSKGVVANIDMLSLKELEKVHLKIDPLTDYITNIFEYDMYIEKDTPEKIYIVDVNDKQCVGVINADFNGDNIKFSANTMT